MKLTNILFVTALISFLISGCNQNEQQVMADKTQGKWVVDKIEGSTSNTGLEGTHFIFEPCDTDPSSTTDCDGLFVDKDEQEYPFIFSVVPIGNASINMELYYGEASISDGTGNSLTGAGDVLLLEEDDFVFQTYHNTGLITIYLKRIN
ncbi:hypothetical protein [Algivirga pacifica]|uniref:Lipocalin-like domain-containing protein n=1 Tax=Algivirga pacifica TaxID=1162670 RepID=A0ABP9D6N6_9BACT